MDGYRFASIDAIAQMLRDRVCSAAELAEEVLAELEGRAAAFNAIATLLPGRGRKDATRADELLRAGDGSLLCGVPYGAKDLFAAVGGPTTWGCAHFRDQVFSRDCTVVARLSRSGAVLVAKLTMSELAGGGRPSKPGASFHGPVRNPWDTSRYAGGSSGGSAAAVAAGLLPYALGTETGGSVIGPSTFCGVTGIRPTFGRVPRDGVMSLAWSLDKVGVIARTAGDCGRVLDTLAPRATGGRTVAATHRSRTGTPQELRSIRVAFMDSTLVEATEPTRHALTTGVDEFRAVAPNFVDAGLPANGSYSNALNTIVKAEGAYNFRSYFSDPAFHLTDPRQDAELRSGLSITANSYFSALATKTEVRRAFNRVFSKADVLLSIARTSTAPSLEGTNPVAPPPSSADTVRAAANLVGLPGIAFPCGLASDGLPVGLHLVGPRGSDSLLVALAAQFQEKTDHHLARPPEPADQ